MELCGFARNPENVCSRRISNDHAKRAGQPLGVLFFLDEKMQGTVKYINPQRGMVAVEVDTNTYSIIELLGDDVEIGDELAWNGYALGSERCFNRTRGAWFEPYFQNHDVPTNQLRQQLLMG